MEFTKLANKGRPESEAEDENDKDFIVWLNKLYNKPICWQVNGSYVEE